MHRRSGSTRPGAGRSGRSRCPSRGADDVMVRTLRSGVSRGTETLVFRGGVPPRRAPFQEGDFPGPVKYGYLNVGAVERGPPELRGRTVFCLYPHQTAYVVPAGAVTVVPEACRPRAPCSRAPSRPQSTRCGMRRRWSATGSRSSAPGWSAAASRACCTGSRHRGHARGRRPARAGVAAALGVGFARPEDAAGGRDLVIHTSATSAGLQRSLELLAPEGRVLDLSWYGDARSGSRSAARSTPAGSRSARARWHGVAGPKLPPHDGRPAGAGARPAARPRVRHAPHRRVAFHELPDVMARLAAGSLPALCHTITYEGRSACTASPSATT